MLIDMGAATFLASHSMAISEWFDCEDYIA